MIIGPPNQRNTKENINHHSQLAQNAANSATCMDCVCALTARHTVSREIRDSVSRE